jgi:hypothetical protein
MNRLIESERIRTQFALVFRVRSGVGLAVGVSETKFL